MKPVPSLRIWICSLAVVCILLSIGYLWASDPVLLVLNHKRLTSDTPKEKTLTGKKQMIVSLGSSLTRHAIYYDDEMEAFARQNGYDKFSFIRFVLGGSHLSQFYPLFDHIIAAKPDIVLFQHTFFAYRKPFIKKHHGQIHSYQYFLKQYLFDAVNIEGFKRYWHNREQQEEKSLKTIEKRRSRSQVPSKIKKIARRRGKWSLNEIHKIPKELDQFLTQAAHAGIKVIVLNLPLPEESKALMPGTDEDYRRLMREYEDNYKVKYLHYPYQLGLESFLDYNHLTPAARKNYASWLLKHLSLQID